MTVLWICYPRFRPLYALCMAAVAVGLVGANFHFLSDVIAGGFLGISAGWLGVAMWEIGDRQVRPPAAGEGAGSELSRLAAGVWPACFIEKTIRFTNNRGYDRRPGRNPRVSISRIS